MRKGFPRGTETWDEIPIHIKPGLAKESPKAIKLCLEKESAKVTTQHGVLINEETIIRNTFVNAQLVTLEESQDSPDSKAQMIRNLRSKQKRKCV